MWAFGENHDCMASLWYETEAKQMKDCLMARSEHKHIASLFGLSCFMSVLCVLV